MLIVRCDCMKYLKRCRTFYNTLKRQYSKEKMRLGDEVVINQLGIQEI